MTNSRPEEELHSILNLHRLQPTNVSYRTEFLNKLVELMNSLPDPTNHFFHIYPTFAASSFQLFLENKNDIPSDKVEQLRQKISIDIDKCVPCCKTYHESQTAFFEAYKEVYPEKELNSFKQKLESWTTSRQLAILKDFCSRIANVSDTAEIKKFRKTTLYIVYELLNYPDTLKNPEVEALFTTLLVKIQESSKIVFKGEIYPGIILLTAHTNQFLRDWALGILRSSDNNVSIPHVSTIGSLLKHIAAHFEFIVFRKPHRPDFSKGFQFSFEEDKLLTSIIAILSIAKLDQVSTLLSQISSSADKWLIQIVKGSQSYSRMGKLYAEILVILLQFSDCSYFKSRELNSEDRYQFVNRIVADGFFEFLAQSNTDNVHSDLQRECEMCFRWLSDFVSLTHISQDLRYLDPIFINLIRESPKWADFCRSFFVEQLLIILQSHSSRLSSSAHDEILGFLLSVSHPPQRAISFAQEALTSFFSNSAMLLKMSKNRMSFPYRQTWKTLSNENLKIDSQYWIDLLIKMKPILLSPTYKSSPPDADISLTDFGQIIVSWSSSPTFPVKEVLQSPEIVLSLICTNNDAINQVMLKRVFIQSNNASDEVSMDILLESRIKSIGPDELLRHLPGMMAILKDSASKNRDVSISGKQLLRILDMSRNSIFNRDPIPPATLNFWIHSFLFCLSILSFSCESFLDANQANMGDKHSLEIIQASLACIRHYSDFRGRLLVFVSQPRNFNKDWFQEILGRLLDVFHRVKVVNVSKLILDEIIFHLKSSSFVAVTFEKSIISYVEKLTRSAILSSEQRETINIWLAGQVDDVRPTNKKEGSRSQSSSPPSAPPPSISSVNMIRVEPRTSSTKPRLLETMKNDVKLESRKNDVTLRRKPNLPATNLPRNSMVPGFSAPGSILAPGLILMEGTLDDDSRDSEIRSIRTIDIPNMDNSRLERITKRASSDQQKSKSFLIDIQNLFKSVLSWDMGRNSDLPPDMDKRTLRRVPDTFTDLNSYAETFEPLMRMETWQQFVQAQEELRPEDSIKLVLEQCIKVDDFHDISFRARFLDVRVQQWAENTILRLSGEDRRRKKLRILANIQTLQRQGDEMIITCRCLLTRSRSEFAAAFVPRSDWEGLVIFSLVTVLREYEALKSLPELSLGSSILKPERQLSTRPAENAPEITRIRSILQVNEPQARAIHAAVQKRSGFVLIQGPPGTGKTKTILGLVGALLKTGIPIGLPSRGAVTIGDGSDNGDSRTTSAAITSFKPKEGRKQVNRNGILVLAPSNAAIDEIARRLKNGIRNMQGQTVYPKLVRIGTSSVHGSVKDISLDELVETELTQNPAFKDITEAVDESETNRETLLKNLRNAKSERDLLHESLNQEDISSADESTTREQIAKLSKRINDIRQELESERDKKNTATRNKDRFRREARTRLLTQADVILSTLSGAGHETLVELKNTVEFPTVIIDEACQAVELSCLIPLKYNVKKCILVGDPNQLPPTVISQAAQDYAYEQSLFQRLMKSIPEAVQLLSIQYRMHPDIVAFPSKYFYDGRLQNAPGVKLGEAEWQRHPFFRPYVFFDVHQGREEQGSKRSYENREEATLCAQLVRLIASEHPSIQFSGRIGVITFYKGQVNRLKREFRSEFGPDILESIDINTVDGFQGQEKDIIILSCVRASAHKGVGFLSDIRRMNVALTRARCTLLILGNADALKSNKFWRALLDDVHSRQLIQDLTYRDIRCPGRGPMSNLMVTVSTSPNGKRRPAKEESEDTSKKIRQ